MLSLTRGTKIILLFLLIFLCTSLYFLYKFYFLRTTNQPVVQITNNVLEIGKISVNQNSLNTYLASRNFWKQGAITIPHNFQKTAKSLKIIITKESLENPYYKQEDDEGNLLIASAANFDNNSGEFQIIIQITDYITKLPDDKKSIWLKDYSVNILNVATRNQSSNVQVPNDLFIIKGNS